MAKSEPESKAHAFWDRVNQCVNWGIGLTICTFLGLLLTGGTYTVKPFPPAYVPPANGYDDFIAAGEEFKRNGGDKRLFLPDKREYDLKAVPQIVEANAETFRLIMQGLTKECRVPQLKFSEEKPPGLSSLRGLVRLMQADAQWKLSQGRYADAFDRSLDSMEFAARYAQGGMLVHGLVSVAGNAIAQPQMLASLDRLTLAESRPLLERLKRVMAMELDVADLVCEDRRWAMKAVRDIDSGTSLRTAIAGRWNGADYLASGDEYMENFVMWRLFRDAGVRELDDIYDALQLAAVSPPGSRPVVPEPKTVVAGILAPVFVDAFPMFDVLMARRRMMVCLVAIHAYRLENGRLPDALAALKLPAEFTTDPYSGSSLKFVRTPSDYLLYSVGADLKDDGGTPQNEALNAAGGDLGIRRFAFAPGTGQSTFYFRRVPHMKPPVLPKGAPPLYE